MSRASITGALPVLRWAHLLHCQFVVSGLTLMTLGKSLLGQLLLIQTIRHRHGAIWLLDVIALTQACLT